jgi:prepilin-type N-terminal cleavage/methylation domain-containing protein
MKLLRNDNGFTLIELIIVIVILAVIATIAIPNIVGSIDRSRKATDVTSAKIIADASARVLALEGQYSGFELAPFDINTLSSSFIPDGDLTDDFQAELFTQISAAIPKPNYKNAGITSTNFILKIESGRIIEVYIGDREDITTGNALMVFPEPDAAYDQ